jgi:hypothetical protein
MGCGCNHVHSVLGWGGKWEGNSNALSGNVVLGCSVSVVHEDGFPGHGKVPKLRGPWQLREAKSPLSPWNCSEAELESFQTVKFPTDQLEMFTNSVKDAK